MSATPRKAFGDLLCEHRVAAGLTQEQLAERAGVSPRAISDLERGQRNYPRPSTVQNLSKALDLGPDQCARFKAAARRQRYPAPQLLDPPSPRSPDARPTNLPAPLTSFIGREQEIAEATTQLRTERLVTLTGPGGVGKTRLALRVGADLVGAYRDGVWLVDLAPLAEPALVSDAIASAVGAREGPGQPIQAVLLSYLRARNLLLILDNCEHLIDVCARLADAILRSCPDVRILATSRERLGIDGEVVWRVSSLPFYRKGAEGGRDEGAKEPDLGPSAPDEYPAVRLFVERVRAVQPSFSLTTQTGPVVAEICRRLDGIPLAIELAASRVLALSVEQVATRLDDRFRLLTTGSRAALPRQQTLAGTVDWSYNLLEEPERTLFDRLSAFAGGFTLEAAEAVCGDAHPTPYPIPTTDGGVRPLPREDVLDLLTGLVNKSLVVAELGEEGVERFHLLETLRQYGREKLLAAGEDVSRADEKRSMLREAEAIHRRHAVYYRDLARDAEPHLVRSEQLVYLKRLNLERDNVRAALRWYLDADAAEEGLGLVNALYWYWSFRGLLLESSVWISQFLRLPSAALLSPTLARALVTAGSVAAWSGNGDEARSLLVKALAVAQKTGDDLTIARAMRAAAVWGGPEKKRWFGMDERELAEEGLKRAQAAADPVGLVISLNLVAYLAFLRGDRDEARKHLDKSLDIARTTGDRQSIAYALQSLGEVISSKHPDEAAAYLRESLRHNEELGNLVGVASVKNLLARLDCRRRSYASAREHFRASLQITRDWRWMFRIAQSLAGLALVANGQDQPERALRLGAAAGRLRTQGGTETPPYDQAELDRALASARRALGEDAAAAVTEDQPMTLEQVVAYALEEDAG